ncbi:MAG: SusC/RagA family protein, partial [Lewinella sp.]|nr:SusC/RagA family protein [Lewinella sp.]
TYNVGIDYAFYGDRLTGSFELYQRLTKDLLNFVPLAAGTNLSNQGNVNVGDMENRGFEVSVNAVPWRRANGEWSVGVNFTRNKNEITRLTATEDPDYIGVATGGISGGVGNQVQIHSVGFPASTFYLYEQVYDDQGVPIEALYVDQNGDGVINAQDLKREENPAPDAFFGITSNFNYGNFDFSFAGRANIGNYIYNNTLSTLADYARLYNSTNYLLNVHEDTRFIDFNSPRYFSDYYLQNGSFFRLDHITVGYRINNLFGADSGRSLRIYGTMQNPFVITNYEGIDPEVFGGIDNNIYPRSRTILFGVNLNL